MRSGAGDCPFRHVARQSETASSCGLSLWGFAYRQKFVGNGARRSISLHIRDLGDFSERYPHRAV